MQSKFKALRCNKGPQISCTNNTVVPVLLPPLYKEHFTIVNFCINGSPVITMARGLGPNFLPDVEGYLIEIVRITSYQPDFGSSCQVVDNHVRHIVKVACIQQPQSKIFLLDNQISSCLQNNS
eukprot:15343931-Ditylum_brightwellii.AAC.1